MDTRVRLCIICDDSSFANLLIDFYLFQSVEQPTRGNNILDLVLTNTPSFMSEPKTGPQFRDSGLSLNGSFSCLL